MEPRTGARSQVQCWIVAVVALALVRYAYATSTQVARIPYGGFLRRLGAGDIDVSG